jgi:hypothetical protein
MAGGRRVRLLSLALGFSAGCSVALAAPPKGDLQRQQPCAPAEALKPLALPQAGSAAAAPEPAAAGTDYRHRLRPTAAGWPVLEHWCVWVEPLQAAPGSGEAQRQQHWLAAVEAALGEWATLLPISRVEQPEAAQVRIWRRRPPLQRLANGRTRASHGRAVLQLLQVQRQQQWRAEPRVEVLLSPGQAPLPLQATALHELGHAFGLWGHSDQAGDALAAVPGPQPVLRLSPRDRATMTWLVRQTPRLQIPPGPAESQAAAGSPHTGPTAD